MGLESCCARERTLKERPFRGHGASSPGRAGRMHATPDPVNLADVLSELFARRGYGRVQGDRQLKEAWTAVAGELISAKTRVQGLRNGVLQVGVSSSGLLSQLVSFQRVELLEKLQTEHPELKIRDLKFRLQGRMR